jgi:glutathione peroxidase
MSKISVKGNDMDPLYKFLTTKSLNKLEDNDVKWNFQKYLIDEKGNLVKVISPSTLPTDKEIIKWIEAK